VGSVSVAGDGRECFRRHVICLMNCSSLLQTIGTALPNYFSQLSMKNKTSSKLPMHFSRGGSYQKVKKLSPLIGVMIKFKVYETHFL
jgi:hypothetical protein